MIFDDTHKHEVWNETDGIRVVLLFDDWCARQIRNLSGTCTTKPSSGRNYIFIVERCMLQAVSDRPPLPNVGRSIPLMRA